MNNTEKNPLEIIKLLCEYLDIDFDENKDLKPLQKSHLSNKENKEAWFNSFQDPWKLKNPLKDKEDFIG